jgi:hypothetical protein
MSGDQPARSHLESVVLALRDAASRVRRSLARHPRPEVLVAYAERELPPVEAERVADHLAVCRACGELLQDYVDFPLTAAPAETGSTAEAEVESAWERLRPRLREPASGNFRVLPFAARSRRRTARRRLAVLAASAVLAVGAAAVAGWVVRRPAAVEVAVIDLYPLSEVERGAGTDAAAAGWAGPVVVRLNAPGSAAGQSYRVEIVRRDPPPTTTWRLDRLRQRSPGEIAFELRPGVLSPGSYRIRLTGNRSGAIAEYQLVVGDAAPAAGE